MNRKRYILSFVFLFFNCVTFSQQAYWNDLRCITHQGRIDIMYEAAITLLCSPSDTGKNNKNWNVTLKLFQLMENNNFPDMNFLKAQNKYRLCNYGVNYDAAVDKSDYQDEIYCGSNSLGFYLEITEKTYNINYTQTAKTGDFFSTDKYSSWETIEGIRSLERSWENDGTWRTANFTGKIDLPVNYNINGISKQVIINLCPMLYECGGLDMDPTGQVLWDNDYYHQNLYYRNATDVVEAVRFVLLHEIAHMAGLREGLATDFASRMIIESRKAMKGQTINFPEYLFDDLNHVFEKKNMIDNGQATKKYSCIYKKPVYKSGKLPHGVKQ